jgi:hypothetical protein
MTKSELLETLETKHAEWEALLREVGARRMLEPVASDWSVKDIVAHITAWETRVGAWLRGAAHNTPIERAPWSPDLEEDEVNAWIYEHNRTRPLDEVLTAARANYAEVVALIRALPEELLVNPQRFALSNGSTLAEAIPGNTYEHYEHHSAEIQRWLGEHATA